MLDAGKRIPYGSILSRPKLRWKDDARVALWIAPNIEHYEFLPPVGGRRDPWPRVPHPDIHGYGLRDYGNRVGLWRMLDMLDRHAIRATVSLGIAGVRAFRAGAARLRGARLRLHVPRHLQHALSLGLCRREERAVIQRLRRRTFASSPAAAARLVLARRCPHAAHARSRGGGGILVFLRLLPRRPACADRAPSRAG